MCSEYLKTKLYDETKSNHIATNVVRQQKFLSQVLERCEHNFDGVKAELEALRKQGRYGRLCGCLFAVTPHALSVCNLDRIRIHVTGNIAEIPLALSTWASFAPVKKVGDWMVASPFSRHSSPPPPHRPRQPSSRLSSIQCNI